MAGISFVGSYSGVDQSTIDKLMQAEKMPLVQLANKKTDITAKQNAWKDVNTRLNSLFDKLKTLQSSGTFTAKTSASSDEKIVSMSASNNAIAGTYKINVEQLATSTTITSGKILDAKNLDDLDKDGKLNLNKELGFEGSFNIISDNMDKDKKNVSATITVEKKDSLRTIVEKINATSKDRVEDGVKKEGTGISASIVDGALILSDEKTGARNIGLSGEAQVLSDLQLTVGSQDTGLKSKFTVNGVPVERDTNSISDVIYGATLNLTKAHAEGSDPKSVYDTITISQDTSKLTTAIQDFVDQYNSTMTFIEDKLAAGTVTDDGTTGRGDLAGDSSLQSLHSALRRMVTSPIGNTNTDIKDISQLGVSTIDRFGKLQFDSSKLTEALSKDPQNVMNFFTSKGSDDKEIGFAPILKDYVDSYITSDKGLIKSKNESFDRSLKDLNKQIDNFNARMVKKEAYYTKMFSALDVAMMQAESQMEWLNGQISAMNAQSAANKR